MSRLDEIRARLREFAAEVGPAPTMLATVVSVDEDELTCVLDDENGVIPDVRLKPVLDGEEGVIIFPKVGAWALAVRIEDDAEWMLVAASEVEKYRIKKGDYEFELSDAGFVVKKGNDSLKDALTLIIEAVQQIIVLQGTNPSYPKLTSALSKINNIFN